MENVTTRQYLSTNILRCMYSLKQSKFTLLTTRYQCQSCVIVRDVSIFRFGVGEGGDGLQYVG